MIKLGADQILEMLATVQMQDLLHSDVLYKYLKTATCLLFHFGVKLVSRPQTPSFSSLPRPVYYWLRVWNAPYCWSPPNISVNITASPWRWQPRCSPKR